MRSEVHGALASALYDTFNTARLSEHPEEVEEYRRYALSLAKFLRMQGLWIVDRKSK